MSDDPVVAQIARNAAADYLMAYENWSGHEATKVRNGHFDDRATPAAFLQLAHDVSAHRTPAPAGDVREAAKDKAIGLIRDLVVELETWVPELLDVLRTTPQARLLREWLAASTTPDSSAVSGSAESNITDDEIKQAIRHGFGDRIADEVMGDDRGGGSTEALREGRACYFGGVAYSHADLDIAQRAACAIVPFYGTGDHGEQEAARDGKLWNDHPAVQGALRALHEARVEGEKARG